MKKWNDLYKNYIDNEYCSWEEYFKVKMKLKQKFLKEIYKYSNKNSKIIECGSGTAKTSLYLASKGYNVIALDKEKEIICKAKNIAKKKKLKNIQFLEGDIFSLDFPKQHFAVSHSSGVLEHFDNDNIVKIINEQLKIAETMIFSVPTKYFQEKMLGNERFLNIKQWKKIIDESEGEIVKITYYHYKTLKNRIIDIIKNPKMILKPPALFVFVLKKKF